MKALQILAVAALAGMALAAVAQAGGDNVKFPENYAKGVLYTTRTGRTTSSIASCSRRRRLSKP